MLPGPQPTSPANNDFKPGFATALMHKDLGLAMDAVHSGGSLAPLGTHAAEIYAEFIAANSTANILYADGEVVSVQPPTHVELEVADTDPGVKGDTATGGSKPATMETGLTVQVPLFIERGDRLRIDTRTREYQTRV